MKNKLVCLAFLLTLSAAMPYSANAAGDPCSYCEAIRAECRAAGGSSAACQREYLDCVYAFGCVIP